MASSRRVALAQQLADFGRELWDRRLVSGSSGNLSVRLDEHSILITPARCSLRNLCADALVQVDLEGRCEPEAQPSSEFPLHLAAYRAREDIAVVMHTHPTFCVVWTFGEAELPRDTVGARETLGPVALVPYYEPGSAQLADACAQALGAGFNTVLLGRHGLTTVGSTFEEAFLRTDLAEEASRIALLRQLHVKGEGA